MMWWKIKLVIDFHLVHQLFRFQIPCVGRVHKPFIKHIYWVIAQFTTILSLTALCFAKIFIKFTPSDDDDFSFVFRHFPFAIAISLHIGWHLAIIISPLYHNLNFEMVVTSRMCKLSTLHCGDIFWKRSRVFNWWLERVLITAVCIIVSVFTILIFVLIPGRTMWNTILLCAHDEVQHVPRSQSTNVRSWKRSARNALESR